MPNVRLRNRPMQQLQSQTVFQCRSKQFCHCLAIYLLNSVNSFGTFNSIRSDQQTIYSIDLKQKLIFFVVVVFCFLLVADCFTFGIWIPKCYCILSLCLINKPCDSIYYYHRAALSFRKSSQLVMLSLVFFSTNTLIPNSKGTYMKNRCDTIGSVGDQFWCCCCCFCYYGWDGRLLFTQNKKVMEERAKKWY